MKDMLNPTAHELAIDLTDAAVQLCNVAADHLHILPIPGDRVDPRARRAGIRRPDKADHLVTLSKKQLKQNGTKGACRSRQ